MDQKILPTIDSPVDLRKLPKEKLPQLAREVRDHIIETVSEKGGHLGAGLGVTDLTIALHYILNTPEDFLVFDVGHQVQAHKIITGRRDAFKESFRQYKGISGLVNSGESEYDVFTTGHGGPSISAALGVAAARRLKNPNDKSKAVAVIGDTSIASGMAFEALNHAGHIKENLVVILNDNEMSISPSVGGLSHYFNKLISNPTYNHLRKEVEKLINRVPKIGNHMLKKIRQIEEGVKHLLVPGQLFEDLGLRYFGPFDGHDVIRLVDDLPNVFKVKGPVLVHVVTKKGKGLDWAEKDPVKGHASTPFDIKTGEVKSKSSTPTYTKVFGQTLIELAEKDKTITALTGGMPEGTGLLAFGNQFPDRFFDVGISEEHGVTFCAGLAREGLRPVCAIYSTFLQRGFDQIMHDVALQNLPVMFFMDRAGLVGEDGPTHHGALDISYLRKLPRMTMLAPRDGEEFRQMMQFMVTHTDGPSSIRYPRGAVTETIFPQLETFSRTPITLGKCEKLAEGNEVLFIAIGSMVGPALEAAEKLKKEGVSVGVINGRFIKPLDEEVIMNETARYKAVVTVEEGCVTGGFGSAILEMMTSNGKDISNFKCLGLPDRFVEGGNRDILLDTLGLTPTKMAETATRLLNSSHAATKASGSVDSPLAA